MTVASLGFAIDSSPLAATASELDKLTSSAARAEQAATKVSGAGTRMSRGFADLNPALDKIVGSLGRLEGITTSIDKRLDAMSQAASRAAKANQVLDRSAVEASTAYKQLEASLNAVQAAQRKSDSSMAASLAQIQKQKDAIAALNAELQKLRNAPAPTPGQPVGRPAANNNFQTANVAAQLFDIGTTAAFMNPATIAIQQGPQLAQALGGQGIKGAVTGLAAGVATLVSPLSLAAVGLTAAAAAAIQFGIGLATAEDESNKLDTALERHDGVLKRLEDRYGSLIDKVKGYGAESSRILSFEASSDIRGLRNARNVAGEEFFGQVGRLRRGGYVADNETFGPGFMAFNDAITRLRNEFKAGRPDFEAFYDSIYKTAQTDPQFAKKADELAKLVAEVREGSRALEEMERVQRRLFETVGPNGMLLSRGAANQDDMGNLALFNSRNEVAARRNRQAFDADLFAIGARSPQQRAEAARRSAAARYDDSETPAQRRARIEQAGALALAQAERHLADAQRDRAMNLDKILQDQQSEIGLIGKTGGAAAALRKEYELTSALRLEAARQGIEVDQKELDLIHERAQALGEMVDQYNQAKFSFDINRQAADARLSPRDRQIVTTLRQYGLPEDLNGTNAAQIGQQLDWQDAKALAKGFGDAFGNELVSGSHDIGKAVLKGLESSLADEASKLWEKFFDGIGNLFADWLTGSKSGGTGGGAIGSVAAALGGKVAANSNVVGGFSGLAPVIPVTRSALPAVSASTDVASYIVRAASARGIDPNIALAVAKSEGGLNSWNLQSSVMKNGIQEPSFGPFQLYKGGGLGNAFMAKTGLDPALAANGPAGIDFALDHASKNGWGAWYGARNAGIGNWEGIGSGASTATEAVNKLADSAGAATKGLSTFGGGLGKMGSALGSAFPAAPAAGGGGGLMSMFGGLFGNPLSFSPQANLLAPLAGTGVGLFADGTSYAQGGLAIVGERGPELVNLPQGSQVFNTNKSAQMMGGGQPGGGIASVRVFVDDDGNWQAKVESISGRQAQKTSQQSLAGYQKTQERGGFGRDQQTYMKRKG